MKKFLHLFLLPQLSPVMTLRRQLILPAAMLQVQQRLKALLYQFYRMKFIALLCGFVCLTAPSFAEKKCSVSVTVIGGKENRIVIYKPIEGYYNWMFYQHTASQTLTDATGRSTLKEEISFADYSVILIDVYNGDRTFVANSIIHLTESGALNIKYDLTASKVYYAAKNQAGIEKYNEYASRPGAVFYVPIDKMKAKFQSSPRDIMPYAEAHIKKLTEPFTLLLKEQKISPAFYKTVRDDIRIRIYNHLVAFMLKEQVTLSQAARDEVMNSILSKIPLESPVYFGLPFGLALYDDYQKFKIFKRIGKLKYRALHRDTLLERNNFKILVDKEFAYSLFVEDKKRQEDLWALGLIAHYSFAPGIYGRETAQQFDSLFPNSKWMRHLRKQMNDYPSEEISAFEYKQMMPSIFLDSADNNRLKDVFNKLPKDAPIFIDVWATWCGPCIGAFRANEKLDSFLLANRINKLYISVDVPPASAAWKEAIKTYALGGSHIRASEELVNDIKKLYHSERDDRLEIPRYLLINKNGTVSNKDLKSPSTEGLFNQILAALNE